MLEAKFGNDPLHKNLSIDLKYNSVKCVLCDANIGIK